MNLQLEQTIQQWQGCYDESWGNLISPEAYSHPAKYARGLIRSIYEYMLEQDYIQIGDTILDPFGGTGNGALDANALGLNWIGCELEQRFVDMGAGCDCTGISPDQWQALKDQFKPDTIGQLAYTDGRHLCPACLAGAVQLAGGELSGPRQPGLFDTAEDSRLPAGFRLAEDGTPYSRPHRYEGNLSRFKKYAQPGTTARLIQGDSRQLRQRLTEVFGGLVSSPPYINGHITSITTGRIGDNPESPWKQTGGDNYGSSGGQLGKMPTGDLDSLITSPPFAGNTGGRGEASRNGIDAALFDRHSGGMKRGTGENPENLDHLSMKGFTDAAISSPPYINSVNQSDGANDTEARIERMKAAGIDVTNRANVGGANGVARQPQAYGKSTGQLGAMPAGDGLVSSPPFEDSLDRGTVNRTARTGYARKNGISNAEHISPIDMEKIGQRLQEYGATEGQLGAESKETFWAAARQIVTESYLALKPGAYSAWVVKAFVRDGQRVDFPGQWRQLCEACGFEYAETIRAMLVKDNGVQAGLNGEDKRLRTERKSFFRRLHESRLTEDQAHLRIDWEEVIIMRKPL